MYIMLLNVTLKIIPSLATTSCF